MDDDDDGDCCYPRPRKGGSMRKNVCEVCGIDQKIDVMEIKIYHTCCRESIVYYFDLCNSHAVEFWIALKKSPVDFSKVATKEN